jgi:hypothetical protein
MANRWQIEIGVTVAGELLIGADDVRMARAESRLADAELIYPSQMRCRAGLKQGGRWRLSKRAAAERLVELLQAQACVVFPASDPKYSRKRRPTS